MEISNICFNFANRTQTGADSAQIHDKHKLQAMKDRIKKIMESNHMTQKIFSQFTGISEGSLSGILNNKTRPTLQMVDAIHKHFPQVSLEWLLYGVGSMEEAAASPDGEAQVGVSETNKADAAVSSPLLFEMSQTAAEPRNMGESSGGFQNQIKYIDKPQRKITEIRVFYDDQTWETFSPKK